MNHLLTETESSTKSINVDKKQTNQRLKKSQINEKKQINQKQPISNQKKLFNQNKQIGESTKQSDKKNIQTPKKRVLDLKSLTFTPVTFGVKSFNDIVTNTHSTDTKQHKKEENTIIKQKKTKDDKQALDSVNMPKIGEKREIQQNISNSPPLKKQKLNDSEIKNTVTLKQKELEDLGDLGDLEVSDDDDGIDYDNLSAISGLSDVDLSDY